MTYLLTPKVNLTSNLDLDLKVKHLTRQVTTNVQAIEYCDKAVSAFPTLVYVVSSCLFLVMLTIALHRVTW